MNVGGDRTPAAHASVATDATYPATHWGTQVPPLGTVAIEHGGVRAKLTTSREELHGSWSQRYTEGESVPLVRQYSCETDGVCPLLQL